MKPNFVNLVLIVPFEVLNPINSVLVADIGQKKKTGCPACWERGESVQFTCTPCTVKLSVQPSIALYTDWRPYRSRQFWAAPGAGCPNFSRYSSPAKERDRQ